MGATLSVQTILSRTTSTVQNVTNFVTRKRKRDDDESQDEINKVIDLVLQTPKRKKLLTTAQYIYQALFQEGRNSDLTVEALGEQFYLHKVYLSQSPYFASMFGGSWLEANKSYIAIDVVDPQITVESLKTVLGSLYNDEITLNPTEIVPILATATMFQLDGIIDKCREVMIETINPKTAVDYYEAACQYGDIKLENACLKWFQVNLMTYYYNGSLRCLKNISIPLMTKLVASPDLFVMQTEFSLYVVLKFWMYMYLHPDEEPTIKDMNQYYCSRTGDTSFLLTREGEQFILAFNGLRIQNLISHHMDVEAIQRDNIIPASLINPVVMRQWKTMLRVNQNEDKGPPGEQDIETAFLENSLRCGRVLMERERHMWRWTGFHYGMDLLMIMNGCSLSIKRNHRPEFEQLLSFQATRRLAIRVTIATLNEQRQVTYMKSTGIKTISLAKTAEYHLMTFERDVKFPLIISANILFTAPEECATSDDTV